MVVIFLLWLAIDSIINFSVKLSSALVASSKTNKDGLLYKALAIPILCLCPPESLMPLSPTSVK